MSQYKFTGVYKEYFNNDSEKLKSEVFMNNGRKEGIYKSYWENGQIHEEINYIDDRKNGIYKSYRENGKLWSEGNYINDRRIGVYRLYWKNGNSKIEFKY